MHAASIPESAVASPYVGITYGSMVIMTMPKPKPVTLCTKLERAAKNAISTMVRAALIFF